LDFSQQILDSHGVTNSLKLDLTEESSNKEGLFYLEVTGEIFQETFGGEHDK
jgi:hypothetical protein